MNEHSIWALAVETVQTSQSSFFKFITANDSGETGGHQAGFHIPKPASPVLFKREYRKGEFYEEGVQIEWQDGYITQSSIKYYGQKTRDEYRLTQFGRGFNYHERISTGDVLVISRVGYGIFKAYILKTENEIESFLNAFGLSPMDSGSVIEASQQLKIPNEENEYEVFFKTLDGAFPSTEKMSRISREIELRINNHESEILTNPDKKILDWTASEYRLFRYIENGFHHNQVVSGFSDLENFLTLANTIMNRRKSRAGKSLEHHLSFIFSKNHVAFSEQMITEGNSKPDFVFPSIDAYRDSKYPRENIFVLAAKTTCKDRWRQILNEADRIPVKHLFTLQQGISGQQLVEMQKSNVVLVVPESNLGAFPRAHWASILTLKKFITTVKN